MPDRSPPLAGVPWDVAQDVMSPQAAVVLAGVAKVLVVWAQDEMRRQAPDPTRKSGRVPGSAAQDEMEVAA
jgi:hypothetical protein